MKCQTETERTAAIADTISTSSRKPELQKLTSVQEHIQKPHTHSGPKTEPLYQAPSNLNKKTREFEKDRTDPRKFNVFAFVRNLGKMNTGNKALLWQPNISAHMMCRIVLVCIYYTEKYKNVKN